MLSYPQTLSEGKDFHPLKEESRLVGCFETYKLGSQV